MPVPLGRELCYRVRRRPAARSGGSYVRLDGCDEACLGAFEQVPAMFRRPDNPNLREVLVEGRPKDDDDAPLAMTIELGRRKVVVARRPEPGGVARGEH